MHRSVETCQQAPGLGRRMSHHPSSAACNILTEFSQAQTSVEKRECRWRLWGNEDDSDDHDDAAAAAAAAAAVFVGGGSGENGRAGRAGFGACVAIVYRPIVSGCHCCCCYHYYKAGVVVTAHDVVVGRAL